MQIENLAEGAEDFTSNVFLIEEDTLVDTGADDIVLERLEDKVVDRIIITHSHWDHIENLEKLVEWFDPVVYAYEPENVPVDAEELADGETVRLGKMDELFLVIHTPGHKDDSICLYSPEQHILFSGDLIFPNGSFGRTDLDEGDRDTLIESIERIANLDVKELYAGHDKATTEDVNDQIQRSLEEARKHEQKYSDE